MSMEDRGRQLQARDSPRRIFLVFCAMCWIAWAAVGALTVGALYMVNQGHELGTRAEVLSVFWWTTYFCLGLPGAVRIFIWVVEGYDQGRKKE